jgi:hypothetical protein
MRAITALTTILALAIATFAQNICSQFQAVPGRCDLNAAPTAQAKCLLRPVKKFGNLGNPLASLPAPLDTLIGQTTDASFTLDQVRHFLASKTIAESDVGGSLSVPLTTAKYFVIHDTSDFSAGTEFASNINSETASINRLTSRVTSKVAHIYVNRVGASGTAVVFESQDPPSGTKFGRCNSSKRRQFLHIENIQPRIRDRSVSFDNDAIAPNPGFTDAQLDRLALLYIVASARSGKWLIPAYHSPIDLGFKNAHDDPQNFDLEKWAALLTELIDRVHAM